MKIAVVLDNLIYPHNVGGILRVVDAVAGDKLWLCGGTPSPVDHEGKWFEEVTKMSVDTERFVRWEKKKSVVEVLSGLKDEGYLIFALHQGKGSVDYRSVKVPEGSKIAVVLGNELEGVSAEALALADRSIEIPMLGAKDCLNVCVACGIGLYALVFGNKYE